MLLPISLSHDALFSPPPPVALPSVTLSPPLVPLRTLANVTGHMEQQLWHSTLDAMERQRDADLPSLRRIRDWISSGVTLDLVTPPPPIFHENTYSVIQHADIVRTRIREYIEFEAITPLPDDHPLPFGIQPLHVIIKTGRKPRLVIDLSRNLNDNLEYRYFSYSSVREAAELSTPLCWYSKLDLSNCFLSFPLHASSLPHFIFRFDGGLYQFTRMPFGLSSAPRICTELLSVVAFELQRQGIDRQVRYLDDFLFIDADYDLGQQTLFTAQQTISAFGLVVNPDKTEGPAQRLAFLGILLDSVAQTLSCTPERVSELQSLLRRASSGTKIKLTALATLIGKLQFAAQVLPGARPFTRRMIDLKLQRTAVVDHLHPSSANPRRHHFALQQASVRLNSGFRADVRFWLAHLSLWNGSQRWRSAQSAPFTFASDASLEGFGFYLESTPPSAVTAQWPDALLVGSGFKGVYSPEDATLHSSSSTMTWCELFAVYAALVTYRSVLRDSCVLFHVDNLTDVHILNRQATRSRRLAGLLREIYSISVDYNISITAKHRPGVDNILADFLSRPSYHHCSDIITAWHSLPASHHFSHHLLSVSVVHSRDFGGRAVRR